MQCVLETARSSKKSPVAECLFCPAELHQAACARGIVKRALKDGVGPIVKQSGKGWCRPEIRQKQPYLLLEAVCLIYLLQKVSSESVLCSF